MAFLGPFLILLATFQYNPLVRLVSDSFKSFTLFNPGQFEFVGFENYAKMVTSSNAINSLLVTLLFALGVVVLVIPSSFLMAVYLNGKLPARGIVRTIIFLPVVTSLVVIATMWTLLLDPSNGLINSVFTSAGLPRMDFLTSKDQALLSIIIMTVWQQLGFATVLFLGGLQSIPEELYEAARVDGASRIRQHISVTIPLVNRTTLFVIVVMSVFSLQAFAQAFVMTGGGPEESTNFLVYNIYSQAFTFQNPGYASALTIGLVVIAMTISLVQMRLLRSRWNY